MTITPSTLTVLHARQRAADLRSARRRRPDRRSTYRATPPPTASL